MSGLRGWQKRAVLMVAAAIGACAVASPAGAHWADLAVGEIVVADRQVQVTLAIPTGLVGFADANGDGVLSAAEVDAHRERLERHIGARLRVLDRTMAGRLSIRHIVAPSLAEAQGLTTGSHSTLLLTYAWPVSVTAAQIHYGLFEPGVPTASALVTILHQGRVRSVVFTPEHRDLTLRVGVAGLADQVTGFIALGMRHILTGYDHVVFLISLLVLGGALGDLVRVVSAFTVAHSITLSLAVLGVIALPGRWVESAIALSIVYVAVENVWRRDRARRQRWAITFAFGLVHGLGFASILDEFAPVRGDIVIGLAGFNLGVEIGQIAIVTAAFGLLSLLRRRPAEVWVRRAVSAGAAAAGLVWFVQRALLS